MANNFLSEKAVLKKLGIKDFRHLTKSKVIALASSLDKMDPEVAKKALEQFPDFSNAVKEVLSDYKESLHKAFVANSDSVKAYYDICNKIIESLQKELENEDLTFEQKKYIIGQMKEIADKVDKKDSENKKWIGSMWKIASVVIGVIGIGALAAVLGGSTRVEANESGLDEDNDEDYTDY